MMRKLEYKNSNSHCDSNNGQLLRDIEEISKALYLKKTPSSNARSKSAGRVRLLEPNSIPDRSLVREDSLYKDKKKLSSSGSWNWKKPLRALTHIGDRKFHCRFYLHVHSIEGLHSNFDNLSLCVHWKRKNEAVHTSLSKVSGGVAEFEETLTNQCCVYGSSSGSGGPDNPVKYESKLFLLYPSVVEAPGLDIGKQWVDLTSFLPRTLEDLQGEKSQGQWTTSFNLLGKAKGASLNVSFGFWIMRDKLPSASGYLEFPELLNMVQKRTSMDNGFGLDPGNLNRLIGRVGSVPGAVNYGSEFLRQSLDVNACREMLVRTGLELSNSINCLYQKLDEGSSCVSDGSNSQELEKHKAKIDLDFVSVEEIESYDWDITDFSITEVGTEFAENEHVELERTVDGLSIKTFNEYDNCIYFSNEMMSFSKDDDCFISEAEGAMVDQKDSACNSQASKSTDLNPKLDSREWVEQENHMEAKAIYKSSRSVKRSLSFDNVAESVARDFFNMLGVDDGLFPEGSDCDPESPRELLLRQFEREALASGNSIFDFDAKHEELQVGSEESEFYLIIHDAEDENKRVSELLKRRKAKILEDLETEALMREWGLNEKDFQNSPRTRSGGFGSPIELFPQEPLPLPQLEEGFGPYLQMKNGGFLLSMSPSLFRNSKNGGNLIVQVSTPAVLPAKMGCDVAEIIQNLASVGVENLYDQINELVPLEDITGKTMKQLAPNRAPSLMVSQREVIAQHESDFVESLNDLTPWTVNKVGGLFLEGLKTQSQMSDDDPPSLVTPPFTGQMSASDLFGLSIPVDEWLSIDAGTISDVDRGSERFSKIMAVHRATWNDSCVSGKKRGLLGTNLTVFHLVQLRDPLRNYEPVGVPMLLLIQLQRRVSEEETAGDYSGFCVTEVHISGANTFRPDKKLWGTAAQRQSGTRWLHANCTARNGGGGNASKSTALTVRPSPLGVAKWRTEDILWSVSTNVCELGVYTRNPDVIFPCIINNSQF